MSRKKILFRYSLLTVTMTMAIFSVFYFCIACPSSNNFRFIQESNRNLKPVKEIAILNPFFERKILVENPQFYLEGYFPLIERCGGEKLYYAFIKATLVLKKNLGGWEIARQLASKEKTVKQVSEDLNERIRREEEYVYLFSKPNIPNKIFSVYSTFNVLGCSIEIDYCIDFHTTE